MRTRIILLLITLLAVIGLYFLPKSVVENDSQLASGTEATEENHAHTEAPVELRNNINSLRARYLKSSAEEKSAIFADSLSGLYKSAGQFDSAAWFSERAHSFFKSDESLLKAGLAVYESYTFAIDPARQQELAEKARVLLGEVLEKNPGNLDVKARIAMTYMSSPSPMQGIMMLREILASNPNHVTALFNMGMLSIQSGQYQKATEYLEKLVNVDSTHIQGQLLLGVAYMNLNDKVKARQQFEKVKAMDSDPSVQATVDSYLKELN